MVFHPSIRPSRAPAEEGSVQTQRPHCKGRTFFSATSLVILLCFLWLGRARTWAHPSTVPASSLGDPLPPSQVRGQISFRTKTRHGIRGLLPKPMKMRLWKQEKQDAGSETPRRFLHVTQDELVFEIEGQDECLVIARGPESAGRARVTIKGKSQTKAARGPPSHMTTLPVDGIFGVYDLLSGPFVAVIGRSKLRYYNSKLGIEFRQVSKVRLIPVLREPRDLDEGQSREETRLLSCQQLFYQRFVSLVERGRDVLLALLAAAFRSHQFYFSHTHDVTNTLQRLQVSAETLAGIGAEANPEGERGSGDSSGGGEVKETKPDKGTGEEKSPSSCCHRRRRFWHVCRVFRGRRHSKGENNDVCEGEGEGDGDGEGEGDGGGGGGDLPERAAPDDRFFWNLGVLGPLVDFFEGNHKEGEPTGGYSSSEEVVARWITPVMSGFLQVEAGCQLGEHSFDVLFVSRRSRFRQGTRFSRRGIDEGGNVANFVETEQAVLHGDGSLTSHVQIRGSIPVFWSSPTNLQYHPPVKIHDDEEASLQALRLHAEDLVSRYGPLPGTRGRAGAEAREGAGKGGGVMFINLVDKKKDQGALGEAFDAALTAVREGSGRAEPTVEGEGKSGKAGGKEERAVEGNDRGETWGVKEGQDLSESLQHVWFDFHHECRNMHWENLDKLLATVDKEFGEQGFYHRGPAGDLLSMQQGVVRTNCMDCLDRTNVVQSLLARRSMLVQLHTVGLDVPDPEQDTALALTLDMLEMPAEELEIRFRDMWGNNADEISMLYAGTPALKGDFTRTGKRTKVGLLQDGTNAAIRYVVNNFQDHRRQEAVDLLLGTHRPAEDEKDLLSVFKAPLDLDLWIPLGGPQPQPELVSKEDRGDSISPPSSLSPSEDPDARVILGAGGIGGEWPVGSEATLSDDGVVRGGGGGGGDRWLVEQREGREPTSPLTNLRMAGAYAPLSVLALAILAIRLFGFPRSLHMEVLLLLVGLVVIPIIHVAEGGWSPRGVRDIL